MAAEHVGDSTTPKPADRARSVEEETAIGAYRVRLDQLSAVKAADAVHNRTISGRLRGARLKVVLEELDEVSRWGAQGSSTSRNGLLNTRCGSWAFRVASAASQLGSGPCR